MNREQAKRHIKNSTYTPTRGCAPYRLKSKQAESEEIQRLTEQFFAEGGHIVELETQQSSYRPTWQANSRGSFEDNHYEG